jgi:hypothetical protein
MIASLKNKRVILLVALMLGVATGWHAFAALAVHGATNCARQLRKHGTQADTSLWVSV